MTTLSGDNPERWALLRSRCWGQVTVLGAGDVPWGEVVWRGSRVVWRAVVVTGRVKGGEGALFGGEGSLPCATR